MSGWPEVTLESLAVEGRYAFTGGPFGSKLTSRDYTDSGVPVIRGSNMNGGRYLCTEEFVYVSDAKVRQDLSANLAHPNDLIFTQRGTLGQVAIVPTDGPSNEYVISQSQMKMTVDEKKADRAFLYYYLRSRDAVQKILSYISSSGVPHINLTVMRNFKVPNPPLRIQQEIADILSAYDDLIENNRRRMELLEQSARLLFKEWFVHLRFPGHEHTKIKDGVPEGWGTCPIKELISGLYDGPHATPPPAAEGPVFLGIKNITESGQLDLSTVRHISESDFPRWTKRVTPQAGDIVFSYEATLGLYAIIPGGFRGCLGRRLALIRPRNDRNCLYYLFLSFFESSWHATIERNRISGATVDRIPLAKFPEFPILIPSRQLLQEFEESVKPIFRQIELLSRANQQLHQARDILLPRLMNGEVVV